MNRDDLTEMHEHLLDLERQVEEVRARRDELIVLANEGGMTAYRIAKALGLAESTVGRIIAKSVQ